MKRPDKIWVDTTAEREDWYIAYPEYKPHSVTEYTRTALLTDDAWLAANGLMRVPEELTKDQQIDACMGRRHDFGLMDSKESNMLLWECREWFKMIMRAINEPAQPTNSKEAASE